MFVLTICNGCKSYNKVTNNDTTTITVKVDYQKDGKTPKTKTTKTVNQKDDIKETDDGFTLGSIGKGVYNFFTFSFM